MSKFVIYKKGNYSIEGALVFGTKSNESGMELKRGKVESILLIAKGANVPLSLQLDQLHYNV